MTKAEFEVNATERLQQLVGLLEGSEGFAEVVASLRAGHGATLDGVRGSSSALVAAALAEHCPQALVVVCPHQGDIDEFVDDLLVFTSRSAETFPVWVTLPSEHKLGDEVTGDRVRLLKQLRDEPAGRLVLTSIQSLVQPVPT